MDAIFRLFTLVLFVSLTACGSSSSGGAALTNPGGPPNPSNGLIGFATLNALGVNGTAGGAGGNTVTVSSTSELSSALSGDSPKIVQVSGRISGSGSVDVGSNTTIVGLGSDAELDGIGLDIRDTSNVIIHNITFRDAGDDAVGIFGSHHVWVDHCTFFQNGDGAVDVTTHSNYVTISWSRFIGTIKTMLIGRSLDTNPDENLTTLHHNWFDRSDQRHPRVRTTKVHVLNNFYEGVTSYGVASAMDADVYVEGNYFLNTSQPTRMIEDGGDIVEVNNIYDNSDDPVTAGTAFDPSQFYSYDVDDPNDIPSIVTNGAGAGNL